MVAMKERREHDAVPVLDINRTLCRMQPNTLLARALDLIDVLFIVDSSATASPPLSRTIPFGSPVVPDV